MYMYFLSWKSALYWKTLTRAVYATVFWIFHARVEPQSGFRQFQDSGASEYWKFTARTMQILSIQRSESWHCQHCGIDFRLTFGQTISRFRHWILKIYCAHHANSSIQDLNLEIVSKSEPKIHKIQRLNLEIACTAALTFRRVWILKIYCAHHANSQYSALWILRLSANTVICMVRAVWILEFQNEFWGQFSEFRTESWNWQQIWAEMFKIQRSESWDCQWWNSQLTGLEVRKFWRGRLVSADHVIKIWPPPRGCTKYR